MFALRWSLAITLSLLLPGCRQPITITCNLATANKNQVQVPSTRSDLISAELQVDATPSMRGFTNNPRQSRYEQTLQLLDVSIEAGWKGQSNLKYYGFGTARKEINREGYITAQKSDFYAGGDIFSNSQLKVVLTPPAPNKLSVVVTDLYQTDYDIASIVRLLKRDYLQKGYAVGILGIKSEFNGTVYDIGARKAERRFNTDDKKNDGFRPFYVVFLGTYSNIKYYFEQLQSKNQNLIDKNNFIIFYPGLYEKVSTFEFQKYPSELPKNRKILRSAQTISYGNERGDLGGKESGDLGRNSIESLRVTNQPVNNGKLGESNRINHTISYFSLPYTLQIDQSQKDAFELVVKALYFDTKKNVPGFTSTDFQPLQLSDWKIDSNPQRLGFSTRVNPTAIQPGIYIFTIDLVPRIFKELEWWKDWNFDESSFDRTSEKLFDGSKTLNFLPFMQSLEAITAESVADKKPIAARLCYAIQRD